MEDKLKVTGVLSQGYGIIPKLLMKDSDLTIEAKAIYAYIASYAGNGSTAFPSVSLICTDLNISENRFHNHKKVLIEKGYIHIDQERSGQGTFKRNIYTINTVLAPQETQHVVSPTPQNEGTVNDSPTRQKPSTVEPTSDKPSMENKGTNNNSLINNSINNNSNKEKESPKSATRIYDASSEHYKLSEFLFEKMLENNSQAKKPNFNSWADHIRKMEELDGRSIKQISNMIIWSQQDSFWKGNILSTQKLREKYDQMRVQALEESKKSKIKPFYGNHNPKVEPEPDWMKQEQPKEEKLLDASKQEEFAVRLNKFRKGASN